MNRTTLLCAAVCFLALGATGCSYVMTEGRLPLEETTYAVLDFQESCYTAMRDYVIMGRAGARRPGPLAGRFFRRALNQSPRAKVLGWRGMERRLGKDVPALGLEPGDVRALARTLGVDMIVVGEVRAYHTAWILIAQWVRVHLKVRCFSGKTGAEVWWGEADDVEMFGVEEDLSLALSRELIKALSRPISPAKP